MFLDRLHNILSNIQLYGARQNGIDAILAGMDGHSFRLHLGL